MHATDQEQWHDSDGETLDVRTYADGSVILETTEVVDLSRQQVLALYEHLGAHLAATQLDADTCCSPLGCQAPCTEQPEPVNACATTERTILEEAQDAVYGDRQADYGHPREDFTRTAIIWTGLLHHKLADGAHLEPEDIARCQIGVKLARDVHSPKRDNRVDMAGYALTLDRLQTGR